MLEDVKEVFLSKEAIQERVQELGRMITDDHQGRQLILIGILKGAAIFMADLARAIHLPLTMDYISISNYHGDSESLGAVRIVKDLHLSITNRDAVLVESIVDTGLTLRYLIDTLLTRQPTSLKVCSLLDKPARRIVDVPIDYKGFDVPDEYLVGYGLAYKERYRNLPSICTLKEEILDPAT